MKKYVQLSFAALFVAVGLMVTPLTATSVGAINPFDRACSGESEGEGEEGGGSSSICGAAEQDKAPDIIKNVINLILTVLGMIAVIMIVIGGIRYTTSNGDASSIKGAKDTILYAVVGLIVAILSYAIVNFVLGRFTA